MNFVWAKDDSETYHLIPYMLECYDSDKERVRFQIVLDCDYDDVEMDWDLRFPPLEYNKFLKDIKKAYNE